MSGSRTTILIRIYLTLVSISLALIAVNVTRRFPVFFAPGDPIVQPARAPAHETAASRSVGPTVNWGGQRR